MRIHLLQREQIVPQPIDKVFPFFTKPENLALITPNSLAFHVLTPSPVTIEQGRVIDYTIKLLGVPVRWRSMITTYDPPWCFVDEQMKGPYSFWHHLHTFERRGKSTVIRDEVRYGLPLFLVWPLHDTVHRLYVRPTLDDIFDHRRDVIQQTFDDGAPASADVPLARQLSGQGQVA